MLYHLQLDFKSILNKQHDSYTYITVYVFDAIHNNL